MENEIWKDVKGYEGYYQVSNMGRVKSMRVLKTPKNGVKCRKNAFLSTKTTHDKQYVLVALCRDGEKKQIQAHRLVAEAFIPNPKNLPCINHKDENPSNNWVGNLEWCTQGYNIQYSLERKGRLRPKSELLPLCAYTLSGEFIAQYRSVWEAIEKLHIESNSPRGTRNNIRMCCKGKVNSACGYVWRYADGVEYTPYKPQRAGSMFLRTLRKFLQDNGVTILSTSDMKVCANGKVFDFGQVVSADEISKMIDSK